MTKNAIDTIKNLHICRDINEMQYSIKVYLLNAVIYED